MDDTADDTDSSATDLTGKLSVAMGLQSCSAATLSEESHIEVLNAVDIVGFMNELISEISGIIGEDATVTRILLSHFKWDKHALLERWVTNALCDLRDL